MKNCKLFRVVVFEGEPGKNCIARSPSSLIEGMNKFLSDLGVTYRRDPYNFMPRRNKVDSILDKKQKISGNYFYIGD